MSSESTFDAPYVDPLREVMAEFPGVELREAETRVFVANTDILTVDSTLDRVEIKQGDEIEGVWVFSERHGIPLLRSVNKGDLVLVPKTRSFALELDPAGRDGEIIPRECSIYPLESHLRTRPAEVRPIIPCWFCTLKVPGRRLCWYLQKPDREMDPGETFYVLSEDTGPTCLAVPGVNGQYRYIIVPTDTVIMQNG